MNEVGNSYLINIAATLTIIAVTGTFAWLKPILPAKRLWRLPNPKKLYIFLSTSTKTNTGDYVRISSGLGQIRALGQITPSLCRAYRDFDIENVFMSDGAIAEKCEGNLIILGGPKNNGVALKIMELLESRLPGYLSERKVIWKEGGPTKEYTAIPNEDGFEEDFGVIIRATNPFNSKSEVLLFAGLHTYGTTAAARFFTTELPKLKPEYAYHGEFMAVVSAKVTNHHVSEPQLLHVARLV